jgi:hypothetical protein
MLGCVRRVGSPEARKPSGSRRSATAAETGSNPTLPTLSISCSARKADFWHPLAISTFASALSHRPSRRPVTFCTFQSVRRNTKRITATTPTKTAGNPTANAIGGPSWFGKKRRGARKKNAASTKIVAIESFPIRCNASRLVSTGNGPTSGQRAPAARASRSATSAFLARTASAYHFATRDSLFRVIWDLRSRG